MLSENSNGLDCKNKRYTFSLLIIFTETGVDYFPDVFPVMREDNTFLQDFASFPEFVLTIYYLNLEFKNKKPV